MGRGCAHSISRPYRQLLTHGLSLTFFELFNWLQKRFRPFVRPPGYDNKYRSRSHRFVERQLLLLSQIILFVFAIDIIGNCLNWQPQFATMESLAVTDNDESN